MSKSRKILATILVALSLLILSTFTNSQKDSNIPLIAIANYGPHSSLQETIDGLKAKLTQLGYIENKTIRYEITDVNFETSLIIQMLTKLKSSKPRIMVAISTPVAQAAKNTIKDIPLSLNICNKTCQLLFFTFNGYYNDIEHFRSIFYINSAFYVVDDLNRDLKRKLSYTPQLSYCVY